MWHGRAVVLRGSCIVCGMDVRLSYTTRGLCAVAACRTT